MTKVDIEGSLSFRDPSTKEELHVESVTLKHKGKKIVIDDWGTVISYQREEDKLESFIKETQPTKPIIVVNLRFLPAEEKTTMDFEKIKEKYDTLFSGYIVAYIDRSDTTQTIYKL